MIRTSMKRAAVLGFTLLLLVAACKQDPLSAVDIIVIDFRDPWPEHIQSESSCAELAERDDAARVVIMEDSTQCALVDAFRRLHPPMRYTGGVISTSICLTFYAADSSAMLEMQIGWAAVTPGDSVTAWEREPENNIRYPYLLVRDELMRVDSQFLATVLSHLPADYLDGIQLDK